MTERPEGEKDGVAFAQQDGACSFEPVGDSAVFLWVTVEKGRVTAHSRAKAGRILVVF